MNEILKKIDEEIGFRRDNGYVAIDTESALFGIEWVRRLIICNKKSPTYEVLKFSHDLQVGIINRLEKANGDLSDRVVKAEGLMSDGVCGKDINVTTKGDAIRKSNDSLVEWYASRIELFCIGEDVRVNPLNKEKCLNFLNQKVVDHENTN